MMNPPPIGEALQAAWNTLKEDPAPILIASLCAVLLGIIPLLGGGLAFAGLMNVALKALRRQKVEPGDGFVAFQAPVDYIVMGLLQLVGIIACCVGIYWSHAIFFPGTLLILDQGLDWNAAKDRCWSEIQPNWVAWTLFTFVVGLVGSLGALLCGIGVLLTLPIATIAFAYAYEQTMGSHAARA